VIVTAATSGLGRVGDYIRGREAAARAALTMPKYCQSIDSRYHGCMSAATDVMTVSGRLATGDRKGYSDVCPIERALKTIGTRSALVILREAFWGARRFEDFAQRAGITEQIASARLKQLVDAGIMTKQPYKTPGQRVRYEYVLTGLGRQLFPVLVSLIEFGLLLQGDAKRLDLVHGEGCGAPITTHLQCAEGHAVNLTQTEARIRPRKKR